MKHYILYNSLAGCGCHSCDIERLKEMISGEAVMCDVTKVDSYTDLILSMGEEDDIIICGGDGTLNRFANNIDGLNIKNDILYFASGSGNDFLHDLNRAVGDKPFKINKYLENLPTLVVNGKSYKFVNGIGGGIDGYCCAVGNRKRDISRKPINYTMIAVKALLFTYKPLTTTISVDGEEHTYKKTWLVSTMNGHFYGGGMMIAPDQDRLNPEKMVSVGVFQGASSIRTLTIFPSIFKGGHTKYTKYFHSFKGHEISVKFNRPVELQIDGETIENVTEYKVYSGVKAEV